MTVQNRRRCRSNFVTTWNEDQKCNCFCPGSCRQNQRSSTCAIPAVSTCCMSSCNLSTSSRKYWPPFASSVVLWMRCSKNTSWRTNSFCSAWLRADCASGTTSLIRLHRVAPISPRHRLHSRYSSRSKNREGNQGPLVQSWINNKCSGARTRGVVEQKKVRRWNLEVGFSK